MNFKFFCGLFCINLIHGKYLLVDVDDQQDTVIKPNGKRCMPYCKISPPVKAPACIPKGSKCSENLFPINIEFSARNSKQARQCCQGLRCIMGWCLGSAPGWGQIHGEGKE